MLKTTLLASVLLLSAVLAWMHFAPEQQPELSEYYQRVLRGHLLMEGSVPAGAVVFIGNSHIAGLCTDAVATPSVNFGIGSDTTAGVLNRLPKYKCLERASAVVLEVGLNDLSRRNDAAILANYRRIVEALPDVPIVVCAIVPVTSERVAVLNRALHDLCKSDPRCTFIDPEIHSQSLMAADDVHRNSDGYKMWIEALRRSHVLPSP